MNEKEIKLPFNSKLTYFSNKKVNCIESFN